MYTLLSLLLVSLLGYIKADEAITTPSNGTTITPGQNLAFRWVSEDDDADVSRFSVALISLVELGSYTPVDGGDGRRYIREQIVLPDGLRTGSYYLGINEREANENGTVLGDYDLTHAVPGDTWDSPVILEVTSSSSKRAIRRDLPTKRQSNNTNNDEMLYSPSNSTLPLGSSFNFTYRVDEDDDPSDRTESVAVSLVRYWTDIQQGSAVRQGDGTLFEGSIDIPQDLATGYYYIGVSDGDDNFTEEQTRPGSYEVTFHSDAQINGNDVDVSGPERPLILFVSGDASSVSASSTPSASGSVTASVPVTVTTTNGAGNVATSAVQSVGNNAASATGAAGKLTIPLGGVLGGLLAWAMV